jgi:hypothetical protein
MTGPFRLVTRSISNDTVEALSTLLEQAKQGALIGIAFAAMYNEGGYLVDAAGEAHRSPTFSRGMIRALDDKLILVLNEMSRQ